MGEEGVVAWKLGVAEGWGHVPLSAGIPSACKAVVCDPC